jgi:hypothetical protein
MTDSASARTFNGGRARASYHRVMRTLFASDCLRRIAELSGRALGAVDDHLRRLVLVDGQVRAPAALVGALLTGALDAVSTHGCLKSRTVTLPERLNWAPPLTMQSPGRVIGILSRRVTGVEAENFPLFEPAPSPLLQTIDQFADTP